MRKLAQGGSQTVSGALQFQLRSVSIKARTLPLYHASYRRRGVKILSQQGSAFSGADQWWQPE